ncbi:disrupter of silencing SAS10 part of small subunit processosome something about silencing 10 [Scheffersomyces coipomensis]|uniref:disrupter of silencing SAS10 part of small subunit processosome something about silencing 10 n=1 Tax=Scheffersomyces coipomensis TaxID=1788519 RepID=UPI00315D193E
MAKRGGRRKAEQEVELNEVDSFHANQEKVLLDQAGEYVRDEEDSDVFSDEEVMGIDEEVSGSDEDEDEEEENDEDDDGLDIDDEEQEGEEEDEEKGWGGRKNYYGGDEVSDEEDVRQMTEEALKQQKRHLQELELDDYIDEDMMEDWKKTTEELDEQSQVKTQVIINEQSNLESLGDEEKLSLLNQSFPEFIPLIKELHQLKPKLIDIQTKKSNSLLQVKSVALSAYLAAITSYFGIFIENLKSGESFTTMKDSPVMETILSSREIWRQANELPEQEIDINIDEDGDLSADDYAQEQYGIEEDDEEEEDSDDDDEDEFVDAQETQHEEFDIDINQKREIKRSSKGKTSDFSEVAQPDDVDLEEKQRRKKTLRFYTSKIDQASAKNNERYSGDLDLPYKERLFERQQRLVEEARKRGLGQDKAQLGADLDDADFGSDDERLATSINTGTDDAYYQSLKESKSAKKDSRRKAHDEAVKAAKEGKLAELQESLGENGKRAINYQILKNKGLTPHRKKEFRNSRVKKRMQYEKAQKKLKSVRQVYDASKKGPYQGETTGIKKGLSRSVKFS